MTRKGFWIGFSYLLGLFLATIDWGANSYTFILATLGLGILCFFALPKHRAYTVAITVSIVAGLLVSTIYTNTTYNKLVSNDGKTVTINGCIQDYSYIGSDTCLVTVKGKIDGTTTTVSFYLDNDDFDYYDKISVTGKVSKISDNINFLSENYNRPKGIFLQGKNADSYTLSSKNTNPLFCKIKHYRNYLCNEIENMVGGSESAFLVAMLCGDKSELTQAQKNTMYHSGIGHLFAVSGTHLVIITALFSFLIRKVIISRKIRYALTLIEIWGFVIFAGMSVSVVRSAIMLTIIESSFLFGRKSDNANSLGLCAIILTAFSPYTAKDPSFLMSLFAAFSVGTVAPKINCLVKSESFTSKISKSIITVTTIMLVTLPLSIYFFDGVSVIAPISNIIIVPICTVALSLSFLIVLTGGIGFIAYPILFVVKWLLKLVFVFVNFFAQIPYSFITSFNGILCVLMVCTCLIPIIVALTTKKLHLSLAWCIAVFLTWFATFNILKLLDNGTKIVILPASKGSEIIVSNNNKAFLIDLSCNGKNNKAVNRYTSEFGIDKLNFAIITDEVYYTKTKLDDDLSVNIDKYFLKADDKMTMTDIYISDGSTLQFSEMNIIIESDKIILEEGSNLITLFSNTLVVSDKEYALTDIEYPLMMDTDTNTVIQTNYNFK